MVFTENNSEGANLVMQLEKGSNSGKDKDRKLHDVILTSDYGIGYTVDIFSCTQSQKWHDKSNRRTEAFES